MSSGFQEEDADARTVSPSRGSDHNDDQVNPVTDSKPASADEDPNDGEERRHSTVQELARQYTQRSIDVRGNAKFVFGNNDPDSPLNPRGEKFSARAWAKMLAKVATESGNGFRKAGFCFQDMNVFGYNNETDYQKDIGNVWLEIPSLLRKATSRTNGHRRVDILRNFDGVVNAGEMLVVLGPPGAGCSTFLKTIAGETNGIYVDTDTYFNYQGLTEEEMHKHHRGDAIYTAEVDVHFPMLSVGDTLTFASRARCPRNLPPGVTHDEYCDHFRDVVMAMYGISHTVNTRVGNEYIRGVSGGERKRVTISEATLSNAPLQCWDNSTRGLDSANAVEFCKTLRLQSELFGQTCAVSIYQAPQNAYNLFDKVLVLYEGRQIFFGPTTLAKQYFVNLGFDCPARQTIPDFLTSMTAPSERVVRPGWENRVPRTPDDFARCWKESADYMRLRAEIDEYKTRHPLGGVDAELFRQQKRASLSRTLSQAMVPASILILALVMFTGFVIPVDYMLGWCRWINYLDPVAYGFEALMVNEFHGRNFTCSAFVPSTAFTEYANATGTHRACSAVGSKVGADFVNGDDYIGVNYKYFHAHKWRNVGILIGFVLFSHALYIIATEYISAKKSKGEILVFKRGFVPVTKTKDDAESSLSGPVTVVQNGGGSGDEGVIQGSTSVFHWRNVCYDIKIKGEPRRILDNVDGWVKPGTLTALMGVSGAGKTTLLDCLADRISMGVISGKMLVDGKIRDESFQRKTGYVQQQDLHLETSTVREALEFSALLRQPANTPRKEKLAYVDEVIKLLDMQEYSDAVVGVLGEGLNVEQRKRLTIGVELVAKPPLLLFVDEPTSGLDSQTSWAILDLLEKLSKAGQSILCTIHQPSAMLFQRFDRLLFLAKGGKTVYFGDIGENSHTLTKYFERNGAPPCPAEDNPAEWMLEAIGAAPGSHSDIDWHQTWRNGPEYKAVQEELERLEVERSANEETPGHTSENAAMREFATSMPAQLAIVTKRVFQQYWRTPSYIYSKFILCISVALFIGLVFLNAPLSLQGLQNQMFAIFNILTIFGQLVQQQMPHFVTQRSLYEVRERPSKTYSWKVFMLSQILTEIPWNSLASVLMFVCVYYPIGMNKNAEPAGQVAERGALMWLLFWQFLMFTCTFAHACIAITDTAESGGNLANVLFMLCLIFCGVLRTPATMPGFWIFMYRISPFTYLISSMLSTGLANTNVVCSANEYIVFDPPSGQTCSDYMASYISQAGGYLQDPSAISNCNFCTVSDTNVFLTSISSSYAHRWRDFGIGMVYIVVNLAASLALYWLVRMPKGKKNA
ncbi:Multidrug resistance protein [Sporothrix eucalyptigena]